MSDAPPGRFHGKRPAQERDGEAFFMRVVFLGSGEFAVPSLVSLLEGGAEVPLVLSQPDRKKGRGGKTAPTPVTREAKERSLTVFTPEKIRDPAALEKIRAVAPDFLVVAAYGQKIPRSILDLPRIASVNVHGSVLPRHRGASPVAGAIRAGDDVTGVTIQLVADEIDAGDIVLTRTAPIQEDDTCGTLERSLALLGAELLQQALRGLEDGSLRPTPQDHSRATLTGKIRKEHGRIDWRLSADEIVRGARASTPWPGAYSTLPKGGPSGRKSDERLVFTKLKALDDQGVGVPGTVYGVDRDGFTVVCGTGSVRALGIQRPGKKELDAASFLRGFPLSIGESFELLSEETSS